MIIHASVCDDLFPFLFSSFRGTLSKVKNKLICVSVLNVISCGWWLSLRLNCVILARCFCLASFYKKKKQENKFVRKVWFHCSFTQYITFLTLKFTIIFLKCFFICQFVTRLTELRITHCTLLLVVRFDILIL